MKTHFSVLFFVCMLASALVPVSLLADGGGRTGRTLKTSASGCGSCHGSSAASAIAVAITGPDTLIRNQAATFTMTISGGPAVDIGCDISARFGTVAPVSSTIKLSGTELTHKNPIPMSAGSVSVQFSFTPTGAGGTDTLYATGISTNGSGTGGDQWNWSPKKVLTILAPTGVIEEPLIATSYALEQNYPNPFNPTTSFTFQLPASSYVALSVFDVRGNEVASLVKGQMRAGTYTETWDAGAYASGVYFYTLQAGSFSQTKKMILIR